MWFWGFYHFETHPCTQVYDLGVAPLPVTVTTRGIMFLVGDPYKPSFVTVTGRGPHPKYDHVCIIFQIWKPFLLSWPLANIIMTYVEDLPLGLPMETFNLLSNSSELPSCHCIIFGMHLCPMSFEVVPLAQWNFRMIALQKESVVHCCSIEIGEHVESFSHTHTHTHTHTKKTPEFMFRNSWITWRGFNGMLEGLFKIAKLHDGLHQSHQQTWVWFLSRWIMS